MSPSPSQQYGAFVTPRRGSDRSSLSGSPSPPTALAFARRGSVSAAAAASPRALLTARQDGLFVLDAATQGELEAVYRLA